MKTISEDTPVDKRIKLYKALLGVLPGGSFLVEFLVERVPNQRAERLIRYIENLNARLETLANLDFVRTHEYAALAENSIIEATKPISQVRLDWITSITVPKHQPTEREIEFRRKALNILSDLSDSDVKCLINHLDFSSQFRMERDVPGRHFISTADRKTLPGHDLFLRHLENLQLTIYRSSLLEKGLIAEQKSERSSSYEITEFGMLFIFVLTDEFPRR